MLAQVLQALPAIFQHEALAFRRPPHYEAGPVAAVDFVGQPPHAGRMGAARMAEGFQVFQRTPDGERGNLRRTPLRRVWKCIRKSAPAAIRAAQSMIVMQQAFERVAILKDARQQCDKNLNEFIAEVELAHWASAIEMNEPVVHCAQPGFASGLKLVRNGFRNL